MTVAACELIRVWDKEIMPFYMPFVRESLSNSASALSVAFGLVYGTCEICLPSFAPRKRWQDFVEDQLRREHGIPPSSMAAVHWLHNNLPPKTACDEIIRLHELFVAELLDKSLIDYIPLDMQADFAGTRQSLQELIAMHGVSLTHVSIHPFPQMGRLPVLCRIYDSPLDHEEPIERCLLERTLDVWSGRITAFPLPAL